MTGQFFYKIFIFAQKSGLSPTMYDILPLAIEKAVKIAGLLHRAQFVTRL